MMRTESYEEARPESGFTLLEVLIAMTLTTIIMGAVVALLSKSQEINARDTGRIDVQQSARSVLNRLGDELVQAGGIPIPEFPSITPHTGLYAGDLEPGYVIEFVIPRNGAASPGTIVFKAGFEQSWLEADFVGCTSPPCASVEQGDLVLIYSRGTRVEPDHPNYSTTAPGVYWRMGYVQNAAQSETQVIIDDSPPSPMPPNKPGKVMETLSERFINLPPPPDPVTDPKPPIEVLAVQVIRYLVVPDTSGQYTPAPSILQRRLNWGDPQPVAYVDDNGLQVTYMMLDDFDAYFDEPPTLDVGDAPVGRDNVVGSVRVVVSGRTLDANNMYLSEDGVLRRTFSSNVTMRNVVSAFAMRTQGVGSGPLYQ